MRRLIQVRDPFVHPIDRQGILNQIICADAEEIDFAREGVGRNGRARDFNHRAYFHFLVKGVPLATKLLCAFLHDSYRPSQFIKPGDHRKHDFDVTDRAGAKNGAQLCLKNVNVLEAKPDGTPTQERIHLISHIHAARRKLVSAKVKSSDN